MGSAHSGAHQHTPALRGDKPGPGSNPGLQSGAKGETGPLWASEESTQEVGPKAGQEWVQARAPVGPCRAPGQGCGGEAPLRPAGGLRDLSDHRSFAFCEKRGSVKESKTFK